MIDKFDELLNLARQQDHEQRLFLVYTQAELPEDASPEQREAFAAGYGGALVPVASVDKLVAEITSFETLEAEACQFVPQWDILFVTAMDVAPDNDIKDAEIATLMDRIIEQIKTGQIGHFVSFDRQGNAVALN